MASCRERSPPPQERRRRKEERRVRSRSPEAEDGSRRERRERSRSPRRRSHPHDDRHGDNRDRGDGRSQDRGGRHRYPETSEGERREMKKSLEGREPTRRDRESEQRRTRRETEREDRLHRSEKEEGREKRRSKEGATDQKERELSSRHPKDGGRMREEGTRKERAEERAQDRGRERRKDSQQKGKDTQEEEKYEFGSKEVIQESKSQNDGDPNFGLSGKLTAETNTYKGVVIKYNEPPEARKPKTRWRLYPFKGDESLPALYIHRQSAFLIGRDRRVVDLAIDHPSCSKQHAVLQYRLVQYQKESGAMGRKVKPYIIDLESTNGTYINNQRVETAKYMELKEKDMIKFGFSSREYVLLHEHSKDEDDEDDEGTP